MMLLYWNSLAVVCFMFRPRLSDILDPEMLDLELEKYDLDLNLRKDLELRRDDIWESYVKHCREILTTDAAYDDYRTAIISKWITDTYEINTDEDELKAIA